MPGIYIPPPPQHTKPKVQHVQAGLWWPAADSAKLRAAARAWREMAHALEGVQAAGQAAVMNVLAENQGPAVDAFGAYWQKWSGSAGYLPSCSQACLDMAGALERYAAAVDEARRKVEELVAEIATAVVIGVALSIFTVGISDVAAGAVSAGLIASAAAVGFTLSETAAAIAATILVGTTLGAVEAMAIDAGAIQPEKILIFHDQQTFSWSEVLQWGEMGAAGGFVGGTLGAGLSAAGDALPTSITDVLAAPAGRLVVGAASGAGSSAIVDELQYGQINPLDVAAGALGGAAGGGVRRSPTVADQLQVHVNRANTEFDNGIITMSPRQAFAASANPRLKPMFRGYVIDKFAKVYAADAGLPPGIRVTRPGQAGPDFYKVVGPNETRTGDWWDITTSNQWQAHVDRYANFGSRSFGTRLPI